MISKRAIKAPEHCKLVSEAVAISALTMLAKLVSVAVSIATVTVAEERYVAPTNTDAQRGGQDQPPVWQNPEIGVCTMLEFSYFSYLHIVGPVCEAAFWVGTSSRRQ